MQEVPLMRNTKEYAVAFISYLVMGSLIGGSSYVTFISGDLRLILRWCLPFLSLAGWLLLRKREPWLLHGQIYKAFFAVSLGLLLSTYLARIPVDVLGYSLSTIQGVAVAKAGDALPIIATIFLIHFITGGDRDGLFLKAGKLRLGLVATAIGVGLFLTLAAVQAVGYGLGWDQIWSALPWILLFVFSNGLLEELWFRALFLKKLEPLIGLRTTLLLTSFVFGVIHLSSTYVIDIVMFVTTTMLLGLIWAWLMRRTNSIWGPVLIHAAADVLVLLGLLA